MARPTLNFSAWFKQSIDTFLSQTIRTQSLILKTWDNHSISENGRNKKLCIFAHFDSDGLIDPYVVYYLEELTKIGVDIIFVTSSENLNLGEIGKVLPYCLKLIQRKNIALDFGSWKIGLQSVENTKYQQLILANDSVYGPFFPLAPLFEQMNQKNLDLWGMTSSLEKQYHLQSYFLVINPNIIHSIDFVNFWNRFRFYRSKNRIINDYEIGLSRLAQKKGWKIGAVIESAVFGSNPLNPTLHHWDTLIEKFHFPFLKTEVLKLNRLGSARVGEWKVILNHQSHYPIDLIEKHLGRVKK